MKRLQKKSTGEIFAWDAILAANPLMREIDVPDAKVLEKIIPTKTGK